MTYKQKITELILDKNPKALEQFLQSLPLTEQVVFFKDFKLFTQQNMFKSGNFSIADTFKKLAKNIDAYEKAVVEEIKAEADYKKALEEQEAQLQELEAAALGSKKYIINCIVNNESNAADMLELSKKIIANEKETGFYDENLWKPILHLI